MIEVDEAEMQGLSKDLRRLKKTAADAGRDIRLRVAGKDERIKELEEENEKQRKVIEKLEENVSGKDDRVQLLEMAERRRR